MLTFERRDWCNNCEGLKIKIKRQTILKNLDYSISVNLIFFGISTNNYRDPFCAKNCPVRIHYREIPVCMGCHWHLLDPEKQQAQCAGRSRFWYAVIRFAVSCNWMGLRSCLCLFAALEIHCRTHYADRSIKPCDRVWSSDRITIFVLIVDAIRLRESGEDLCCFSLMWLSWQSLAKMCLCPNNIYSTFAAECRTPCGATSVFVPYLEQIMHTYLPKRLLQCIYPEYNQYSQYSWADVPHKFSIARCNSRARTTFLLCDLSDAY